MKPTAKELRELMREYNWPEDFAVRLLCQNGNITIHPRSDEDLQKWIDDYWEETPNV